MFGRIAVGWLLAIALLPAAVASAAQNGSSAWGVMDKVSALDGAHDYFAVDKATNTVANIIGSEEAPNLAVSCNHTGLHLTVMWPDFIEKDYDQTAVSVSWKVDPGQVQNGEWTAGEQIVLLSGKEALSQVTQWANGGTLVVRVPDKHGGQEATFSLNGLGEVLAVINSRGCG